jgi:hypothetical protein
MMKMIASLVIAPIVVAILLLRGYGPEKPRWNKQFGGLTKTRDGTIWKNLGAANN